MTKGFFQWIRNLAGKWTPNSEPQPGTNRGSKEQTPDDRGPDIATGRPFSEFKLRPELLLGLEEAGLHRCTPIQDMSLLITLEGRDLAAQAQTGSGKTAVFLITIFHRLLNMASPAEGAKPRALILAPTRELALQIEADARLIGRKLPFRFVVVYGGVGYEKQKAALRNGMDVVIATPGRLIDLMKQGIFDPKGIRILVIDEADRMLDMGFIRDLRFILRRLPPYKDRQSMLFSATLSTRVLELTYEYMNVPEEVVLNPDELVVETVCQELYHVGRSEKFSLLLGLLQREKAKRTLVFTNTKAQASRVAERLKGNGFRVGAITGDLSQSRRVRVLKRFKRGEIDILVATDVASRGLHIEDVTHVVNYDVPQDPEEYVHRIGRTARVGKTGKAMTLACEDDVYGLEAVEKLVGQKIPVCWAEDSLFLPDRSSMRGRKKPSRGKRVGRKPARRQPSRKAIQSKDGPIGRRSRRRKSPRKTGRKKADPGAVS